MNFLAFTAVLLTILSVLLTAISLGMVRDGGLKLTIIASLLCAIVATLLWTKEENSVGKSELNCGSPLIELSLDCSSKPGESQ